jgi:hypothetical protein
MVNLLRNSPQRVLLRFTHSLIDIFNTFRLSFLRTLCGKFSGQRKTLKTPFQDLECKSNDMKGNNVTHGKILFWHLHK